MKLAAHIISLVFHPLILVLLLVNVSYSLDYFSYYINDQNSIGVLQIMNFVLLVLLPLVGVLVLYGLNMISSFKMSEREDRIAPLIITMTFYIWYFINVFNNAVFPNSLKFIALGITLTVALAFFINNFSKISLHTTGAGSFVVGFALLLFSIKKPFFHLSLWVFAELQVSAIFAFILTIIIAGIIGSSRLYLKAHTTHEVYGGYLAGMIAQLLAFKIII